MDTNPVASALQENQARRAMWDAMFRHEGWREVTRYLEKRYIAIGQEECDSLVKLSARNARLSEIKKLFAFIMHDFKMEDALIKEYQALMDTDGVLEEMRLPRNF